MKFNNFTYIASAKQSVSLYIKAHETYCFGITGQGRNTNNCERQIEILCFLFTLLHQD